MPHDHSISNLENNATYLANKFIELTFLNWKVDLTYVDARISTHVDARTLHFHLFFKDVYYGECTLKPRKPNWHGPFSAFQFPPCSDPKTRQPGCQP